MGQRQHRQRHQFVLQRHNDIQKQGFDEYFGQQQQQRDNGQQAAAHTNVTTRSSSHGCSQQNGAATRRRSKVCWKNLLVNFKFFNNFSLTDRNVIYTNHHFRRKTSFHRHCPPKISHYPPKTHRQSQRSCQSRPPPSFTRSAMKMCHIGSRFPADIHRH